MSTRKPTPAPLETTSTPLEGFYDVKRAAIRLGLQDESTPDSTAGERWLRDGCNRPADGSQGPRFPHTRMSGRLIFSDSQLAEIAEISTVQSVTAFRRRHRKPARAAA